LFCIRSLYRNTPVISKQLDSFEIRSFLEISGLSRNHPVVWKLWGYSETIFQFEMTRLKTMISWSEQHRMTISPLRLEISVEVPPRPNRDLIVDIPQIRAVERILDLISDIKHRFPERYYSCRQRAQTKPPPGFVHRTPKTPYAQNVIKTHKKP
jgi:hypothetical protein